MPIRKWQKNKIWLSQTIKNTFFVILDILTSAILTTHFISTLNLSLAGQPSLAASLGWLASLGWPRLA